MEEKILKRWLKRKIKITVVLMIGFLITGGVVFGFDLPAENNEDVLKEYTYDDSAKGTDFAIRGTDIPSVTGKVGYSLEYERINGIIGTLSASYEFGGDYKNFETSIGLGYRF